MWDEELELYELSVLTPRTCGTHLTSPDDDGRRPEGSMSGRQTVNSYFSGPEQLRRTELVWGIVREPPAPKYGHQSVVTRTVVLLDHYVREHGSGRVCVSPVDVVLDPGKALVVQPDVVCVSNERLEIVPVERSVKVAVKATVLPAFDRPASAFFE